MKRVTLRSIQLQGANGFPIALYRPIMKKIETKVLSILDKNEYQIDNREKFRVDGCDLFQHVFEGRDWSAMVNKLAAEVEKRTAQEGPLICIGHSFGNRNICKLTLQLQSSPAF